MTSKDEFLATPLSKSPVLHPNPLNAQSDELASSAFAKITENWISSVPVYDPRQGQYTSFLDNRTFVAFVLQTIKENPDLEEAQKILQTATCQDVIKIGNVANWSNTFVRISESETVRKAIGVIVNMVNIHRLPVFNLAGDLVGIVSQSKVLIELAPIISEFPFASMKVKDLRLGYKEVLSISSSSTMLEALNIISDKKISGLAVTDGKDVVGNVSVSDIRIIGSSFDGLAKLNLPLSQILCETQKSSRPIMAHPNMTIQEVLNTLVKQNLHRLYVVSEQGSLLGVLSSIDILDLVDEHI